jgi:hypothetical protein
MSLIVNRDGDLITLKAHELAPGRVMGVTMDEAIEQNLFSESLESLGMVPDDATLDAIRYMPARAVAELEEWRLQAPVKKDTAWLNDFLALFTAVQQRRYADAKAPAHEPPIPYFKSLATFYLAYAEANKDRESEPDWKRYTQPPEFFVLNVPIPATPVPPLGDVRFSDQKFQALITRRQAHDGIQLKDLEDAAVEYDMAETDGVNKFLNQVKASLLDPWNQSDWPFRSPLVGDELSRHLILQNFDQRLAVKTDPDLALIEFASIGPLVVSKNFGRAVDLFRDLAKRSPYLARKAVWVYTSAFKPWHIKPQKRMAIYAIVASENNLMGPNPPALCLWALKKVAPLANWTNESSGNQTDPASILLNAPYAQLLALTGSNGAPKSPAPAVAQSGGNAGPAVSNASSGTAPAGSPSH